MTFYTKIAGLLLIAAMPVLARAEVAPAEKLDFTEVFNLLKAQLPDMDESTLNEAAARGLIEQLEPRVHLARESAISKSGESTPAVAQTRVFDSAYAYVRLANVGANAAQDFKAALQDIASSNQLKGLVIDLRFARDENYAEALKIADQFLSTQRPLLDWGQGLQSSTVKTNALSWPVVALINHQTGGAAEALAGMIRHGGIGLLIGSQTAGEASMYKEYSLSTGQKLRIASAAITLGDGKPLASTGLGPDLEVNVSEEKELTWLKDPYLALNDAGSGSAGAGSRDAGEAGDGRSGRRRLNEADLVRMLREGEMPDFEGEATPAGEKGPPVLKDPVLARGLDFLKGLAVVRQFKDK